MLIPFRVFPNADGLANVNDIAKKLHCLQYIKYLIFAEKEDFTPE